MTLPLRKKLRTTVQSIRFRAKALNRQAMRSAIAAGLVLSGSSALLAQNSVPSNWQPNRLPAAPSMQPLSSTSSGQAQQAAQGYNTQAASGRSAAASSATGDSGVVLRWRTSSRLTGTESASVNGGAQQFAAGNTYTAASAAAAALEQADPNRQFASQSQGSVVTASGTAASSSTNAWSANPLRTSGAAQSAAARQPFNGDRRETAARVAQPTSAVRTAAYQPPAGGGLPPAAALGNEPLAPPTLPGSGLQQLPVDPLGQPEMAPLPPGNLPGNAPGNSPSELPLNPPSFPANPVAPSEPPSAIPNASPTAPGQNWPGNAPSIAPGQNNELRSEADNDQPPAKPDPFERRRLQDELDSPSDRQGSDKREEDLKRKRPGNDASLNCESFRDRLRKSTLDKVNLNSAPRYGQGLNADLEEAEKQRLSFAASAETRDWCDRLGRTLVQGRMVDLQNEQVVLDVNGQRREIALRDLCDVDLAYVGKAWNLPVSCGSGYEPVPGRDFVASAVQWKASGLCHKPLYFEEVQLERYGHEIGPVLQPLVSTAHFFGNIAVMPYKMGIHPPHECQYALGYYRPGDCAPYMIPPIPFSLRGALVEAGVVTGAAALIP